MAFHQPARGAPHRARTRGIFLSCLGHIGGNLHNAGGVGQQQRTLPCGSTAGSLVEEAAGVTGESVNSWVVNALSRAGRSRSAANRVKGSFDL